VTIRLNSSGGLTGWNGVHANHAGRRDYRGGAEYNGLIEAPFCPLSKMVTRYLGGV
jgi:hypothetical protein